MTSTTGSSGPNTMADSGPNTTADSGPNTGADSGLGGGRPGRGAWSSRHHLGIVAAAATLLATAPLLVLFERWTWFVHCALAVTAVAAAAAGARALRAPGWLQLPAMLAALLLALTWQFRSGEELLFLPTAATLEHFQVLLAEVPHVVASEAIPVPDREGLLLLTALGVGLVAIMVDLISVAGRRPALAGLPMLAIYSVPVAVSAQSVHALTFAVGVVGYLWLVATDNLDRVRRFGRRFTGDGRNIEAWEPSPLAAAGRRLTLVGVLIAVMVPLAVPGMTTGLVDRFGSGIRGEGGGGSGSPTAVNLFAHLDGLLNRDETVELLQVTTDDPDPFYLRVGTADQISERGFDHRPPHGDSVAESMSGPVPPGGITQHRHRAEVEVLAWDMNRLPTYASLTGLSGAAGDWRYDEEQQVVFAEDERASGLTYEFEFLRREYDPDALAQAEPLANNDPIQRRYAQVIDEPQVAELVADITEGHDNPYDRVRAILGHFSLSNGFRYSLETGSETSGSAIADFLFEHRAGFCVQYAAAMTWMVRQAGMPARVVTGFTRGNEREDDTYVLTNHNLHAWTEVYFDGFGWVPFDPTPSSSVAGSAQRDWAPDPNVPDRQESAGDAGGPDATPLPPGDGPDEGPEFAPEPGGSVGGAPDEGQTPWLRWLLVGAVAVLVLLTLPALRRTQLRLRRVPRRLSEVLAAATGAGVSGNSGTAGAAADGMPGGGEGLHGDPAAANRYWAHQAWDELRDTMVDYRLALDPAETPRGTAERVVRERRLEAGGAGVAGDGVRALGWAEERARYSRAPLPAGGLPAAVRAVRRELARQSGLSTRVRAVLMPPSTLARWRSAMSEVSNRAAAAMHRARGTLAQLSPRRLLRSS